MKIYIYPQITQLHSHKAASYINLITKLAIPLEDIQAEESLKRLKERIAEDSLDDNLKTYFEKVIEVE